MIASDNVWDWLGPGIYFWEQNPGRALEYAIECAAGRQKNKIQIKTPFVVGAVIELGNCLNMLEPVSINIVKKAYTDLVKVYKKSEQPIPTNKDAIRKLDCAVIKYVHKSGEVDGLPVYDTVRSAFNEGGQIYTSSNFYERLHIEICVRNSGLIKGYFLPRPISKFNHYLKKSFYYNK